MTHTKHLTPQTQHVSGKGDEVLRKGFGIGRARFLAFLSHENATSTNDSTRSANILWFRKVLSDK